MSRFLFICILFAMSSAADAQLGKGIHAGTEQDILPYVTGGYFFGGWIGKGHVRIRGLKAKVHKPDLMIKKGFTNNRVAAYAVVMDYFLKEGWRGWWAGTGLVYWKNSIQTDKRVGTASYPTWLLNGSIGYDIKLAKKFYLSPWCAMHVRIAGAKHVIVDDKIFTPALFNPEASVKFGIYF